MGAFERFIRLLTTGGEHGRVATDGPPVAVVLAAATREGLEDTALELADALVGSRGRPVTPEDVADLAAWLSDHGDAADRPHWRVEVGAPSPAELARRLVLLATTGDAPGVRRDLPAPAAA